jgi:hypothetical protein
MGPLQFIFVACLSADPETCREVYGPIFGQPIAQSTCMLEGPAITAAWATRYPGWAIREWTCRPHGERDV